MRKGTIAAALAAVRLFAQASLLHAADPVLAIGGAVGWDALARRDGVVESAGVSRYPVQTLASARPADGAELDLVLGFDAAATADFRDALGRYAVSCGPEVAAVGASRARAGTGAALFVGSEAAGAGIAVTPGRQAAWAPGARLDDWSISFWLYPTNLANGEQILSWTASRRAPKGDSLFQRINCLVVRNKLEWNFADFFTSPDQAATLSVTLDSRAPIVPRVWSHHLVQFEAATGLLEYRVDDKTVAIAYATPTGAEGGEVYSPVLGIGGVLNLGARYNGLLDEFRLAAGTYRSIDLSRYPAAGGRLETRFLDLGAANTEIRRIELSGTVGQAVGGQPEIRLFARAGETPYGWPEPAPGWSAAVAGWPDDDPSWRPIAPGADLAGALRGRWLQLAVRLYPDGAGEAAPRLEEIRIVYAPDEAPPPPALVTATVGDGSVTLNWRPVAAADLAGYLIYYGEATGEYFGSAAAAGPSPIDVGNRTSFTVDGLRNGTLYFFAVAAYDRAQSRHVGAGSREVAARPARMAR
jgi:hypothetical protein